MLFMKSENLDAHQIYGYTGIQRLKHLTLATTPKTKLVQSLKFPFTISRLHFSKNFPDFLTLWLCSFFLIYFVTKQDASATTAVHVVTLCGMDLMLSQILIFWISNLRCFICSAPSCPPWPFKSPVKVLSRLVVPKFSSPASSNRALEKAHCWQQPLFLGYVLHRSLSHQPAWTVFSQDFPQVSLGLSPSIPVKNE